MGDVLQRSNLKGEKTVNQNQIEASKQLFLAIAKKHTLPQDHGTFEGRKHLLTHVILFESEELKLVTGVKSASVGMKVRDGLLIATSQRLILVFKKGLMNSEMVVFPYEKISTIGYKSSFSLMDVIVHVQGGNEQKFAAFRCELISQELQQLVNAFKHPKPQTKEEDVVGKLERLYKLKETGAITTEEYEKTKQGILNR